jgi:hypothetical protein
VSPMKRLRVLLVCLTLQFGLLTGVPMRPGEIEELMREMNEPTLARVLPSERDEGDDPLSNPPNRRGGSLPRA